MANKNSTHERTIIAVIPAAGVGERMGMKSKTYPKQYLTLRGKTVLEHSVETFLSHEEINRVIVAVAENDVQARQLSFASHPKVEFVQGGATRAESVLNALRKIENTESWVLVHDGARPCVQWQDIQKLLAVEAEDGAILAVPVVDTLKRAVSASSQQTNFTPPNSGKIFLNSEGLRADGLEEECCNQTVDRQNLWQAQTPQFFPAQALRTALEDAVAQGMKITDEASCMELKGKTPRLILGSRSNIKITYPEDLALAEFYLNKFNQN